MAERCVIECFGVVIKIGECIDSVGVNFKSLGWIEMELIASVLELSASAPSSEET